MFKRDAYREVFCVLKTKRDVCAFMVLCVVHARKINVTCLVKVLSKNGSRGQKYTLDAFSAVCPPDVLYLFIAFVSLSFSLSRRRLDHVLSVSYVSVVGSSWRRPFSREE